MRLTTLSILGLALACTSSTASPPNQDSTFAPPPSGPALAATASTSTQQESRQRITVGADGLPLGQPSSAPGLRGVLGDASIAFEHVRLVYTANRFVELRAERGDAWLQIPVVVDPLVTRCVERPLGAHLGKAPLAVDPQRYSTRFAYRLRVHDMTARAYDNSVPPTRDGQTVGWLSGDLIAVFQDGEHSPLGGWLAGTLDRIPVVRLGDPGREQACAPTAKTEPLRGHFKGKPTDYKVVAMHHRSQSSDYYDAGYELVISAVNERPRLTIRFVSVPSSGTCIARRSAHSVDPGSSGGNVPRFRLDTTHYHPPTNDKPGSISGYVHAEFRPDTIVEGSFASVPVFTKEERAAGPRPCRER